MRRSPVTGILVILGVLISQAYAQPPAAEGQELGAGVKEAYFRALAEHFDVTLEEVSIVGAWDLAPDEVPVVLFVARKAGVSPDALIGTRRTGRTWQGVAERFGLGTRSFHLPLPSATALGGLDRAYGEFRTRPPREWSQIDLTDSEIVALVNLRVLSEQLAIDPLRVLQSKADAGSFAAGFASLLGHIDG